VSGMVASTVARSIGHRFRRISSRVASSIYAVPATPMPTTPKR
jgi:hypothetical protein